MSGCFWPQDDQVFSEIPRKRNSPPRILLNTVYPELDKTIGPACKPPFSFYVEDPDVADRIYNRWFVYKPGEKREAFFENVALPSGSTTVRQQLVSIPSQHYSAAAELMQNGEHRLEVVVADYNFAGSSGEPEDRPPVALGDGGTIADKSYFDTYVWIVKTSDTTAACPDVRP